MKRNITSSMLHIIFVIIKLSETVLISDCIRVKLFFSSSLNILLLMSLLLSYKVPSITQEGRRRFESIAEEEHSDPTLVRTGR